MTAQMCLCPANLTCMSRVETLILFDIRIRGRMIQTNILICDLPIWFMFVVRVMLQSFFFRFVIMDFPNPMCVCVHICVCCPEHEETATASLLRTTVPGFSLSSSPVTASPTSASSHTMAPLQSWHQAWLGMCYSLKGHSKTPMIKTIFTQ